MGKEVKTNAMRMLERAKVPYTAHEYPHEEGVAVDGIHVAQSMGEDPASVFKTLVTKGSSGGYFVFVIPVAEELDLKAAARSVGEKSVAMLHVADLLKVTGYVRGGCSPVATVALNGAKNAAWLAAEILALGDEALDARLEAERVAMSQQIAAKEAALQQELAAL